MSFTSPAQGTHTSQLPKGTAKWVQDADPCVHIVSNRALVDPAISHHLNANEVQLVQDAVTHYNNLPLLHRQSGTTGTATIAPTGTFQPHCCVYQWSLSWQWWGAPIWLNNSAAQNFGIAMGVIGAGIGAVIGAILGSITAGAAAFVDNECGNKGIYIEVNWLSIVTLSPVC